MNIILVHGIFDTAKIFKPMARKLEANGHKCFGPNLKPFDGRLGLIDLAKKLQHFIDQKLGKDQPIAIIGFSMGGLVARYYLQYLDGYKRTLTFFSISSPHSGTWTAYCYFGKGARDMRPNSRFLAKLAANETKLSGMNLYSYRTPLDAMIIPSVSSDWKIAKNIQVKALTHNLMLYNQTICADIVKQLRDKGV
jgi:triacylglycerol lipase